MDALLIQFADPKLLFGTIVGLIIGVLAGVTGLPLGALRLPVVYSIVPTPHIAAGTNLGIDILTAVTASYRYWKGGFVNVSVLFFMGGSSCIGAFLGGYSSKFVSYKWLLIFIGLTYFCVGLDMLRGEVNERVGAGPLNEGQRSGGEDPVAWRKAKDCMARFKGNSEMLAALSGFVLGFVGGMAGLLMGSLRVPAMIKAMGLTPAAAAGTNMVISLFTAVSGFGGHLVHRNLDLPVLFTMGVASMIGAYVGAKLGVTLSPSTTKKLIGMAIVLMATALFINGIRL